MSTEKFDPTDFIPEETKFNITDKKSYLEGSSDFLESNSLVAKIAFLIFALILFEFLNSITDLVKLQRV